MRMSSIIADVLQDVMDDLDPNRVPNSARIINLFNELISSIALVCECIDTNISKVVQGYAVEPNLLALASTTTRLIKVGSDAILPYSDYKVQHITSDYYRGWTLTNSTTGAAAIVTDSSDDGAGATTLRLSHAIAGQVSGDYFTLERSPKSVELPWYLIRPKQKTGVQWNSTNLIPGSLPAIKAVHDRNQGNAGTPSEYALEQISGTKQRLWIYPMPSEDGVLKIIGARRPAKCFTAATTTAGDDAGDTLISTAIPSQPVDYYVGSEVELRSGSYVGEVRSVGEYDPTVSAGVSPLLRFEDQFSGKVATSVNFELLCGLPDDFEPVIKSYLKWQVYLRDARFASIARMHKADYDERLEEMRAIYQRRNTANLIPQSRTQFVPKFILTGV